MQLHTLQARGNKNISFSAKVKVVDNKISHLDMLKVPNLYNLGIKINDISVKTNNLKRFFTSQNKI